ncbi:O-acetyl-ADP-ribose deacetylase MACROD1 [Arapaima gigas]
MAFPMSALAAHFRARGALGALCRGRTARRALPLPLPGGSAGAVRSGHSGLQQKPALDRGVRKPPFPAFPTVVSALLARFRGLVNGGGAALLSTSSAAPKCSRSNARTWGSRRGCWGLPAAFGLFATVACLHSGTVSAMASGSVNLDSPDTDWKAAKKLLLAASPRERRKLCRVSDVLPLSALPVWTPSGQSAGEACYQVNEVLNSKISLFRGDITKLEVDGIVNAANKTLLGGGGVDGAIHRGAGPLLKKECATLGGCETGQAKITGAYGLPAKYVIHTVGPIAQGAVGDREREALCNCYRNCLDTATQNQLRTVAFPCISTGVYGYPPDQAVDVALTTVRKYLEKHHAKLDRVIFCVFLKSDEDLYQARLPVYFPQGPRVKSKLTRVSDPQQPVFEPLETEPVTSGRRSVTLGRSWERRVGAGATGKRVTAPLVARLLARRMS